MARHCILHSCRRKNASTRISGRRLRWPSSPTSLTRYLSSRSFRKLYQEEQRSKADVQKTLRNMEQRLNSEVESGMIMLCSVCQRPQIAQLQGEVNAMQLEQYQTGARIKELSSELSNRTLELENATEKLLNSQVPWLASHCVIASTSLQTERTTLEQRLATTTMERNAHANRIEGQLLALQACRRDVRAVETLISTRNWLRRTGR